MMNDERKVIDGMWDLWEEEEKKKRKKRFIINKIKSLLIIIYGQIIYIFRLLYYIILFKISSNQNFINCIKQMNTTNILRPKSKIITFGIRTIFPICFIWDDKKISSFLSLYYHYLLLNLI